jgi:hypothetical protein
MLLCKTSSAPQLPAAVWIHPHLLPITKSGTSYSSFDNTVYPGECVRSSLYLIYSNVYASTWDSIVPHCCQLVEGTETLCSIDPVVVDNAEIELYLYVHVCTVFQCLCRQNELP